jgi:AcrR family transcriptional regulator
MATRAERSAAPRPPLTRERVLAAALELADRDGIAGLTMRRLAAELGVEAMTLYHHVGNKETLVATLVERVVEGFTPPDPAAPDWRTEVRTALLSAHAVLEAHRWACPYLQGTGPMSLGRLRWMEALLARLRSAGFSARQTHHAYHVLDSHLIGSTLWAAGYATAAAPLDDLAATARAALDPAVFPALIEHIDVHLAPRDPEDRPTFEVGLDLILDGLARLLHEADPPDHENP